MNIFKLMLLVLAVSIFPISSDAATDRHIIAFAQDTMANDFRRAQVYEVRDEAAKYPQLSFIYSDAQGQTSLMIRQVEQFIEQKVDLLIISTNDADAVVPVVTKAYRSGIPVIVLDRGINGTEFTSFINADNAKIGTIAAAYIAKRLDGRGLVLLFEGLKNADVTQLRSKGFLEEIRKYKGVKVIRRTGNFLRKDAVFEMEKLLNQGIRVDAIFSESDSMLSGVRMVLSKKNIDPRSIVMLGTDFISEAQDAIRNGVQNGSILYPLGGKKAVEIALKILSKEPVPRHIVLPTALVTKENVEQVRPIF